MYIINKTATKIRDHSWRRKSARGIRFVDSKGKRRLSGKKDTTAFKASVDIDLRIRSSREIAFSNQNAYSTASLKRNIQSLKYDKLCCTVTDRDRWIQYFENQNLD